MSSLVSLLIRTPVLWDHDTTLMALITSVEAPCLTTDTLGLRASWYEFWEDTDIQSIRGTEVRENLYRDHSII